MVLVFMTCLPRDFYPRSPCGERQTQTQKTPHFTSYFYPRSPCGERLAAVRLFGQARHYISIHALLAESDRLQTAEILQIRYFYPRSPCGERLVDVFAEVGKAGFLSTLSLRRATASHLPLPAVRQTFLSTLSLRRATGIEGLHQLHNNNFYPRSPCGERLGDSLRVKS